MKIEFESIYERDIDLLMMSICSSSEVFFAKLLEHLNIPNSDDARILSIEHSYADNTGESDITIIFGDEGNKRALLFENKIDAQPQKEQKKRYIQRGENGIKAGKYSAYFIALIAPEEYLAYDTQEYPNKISYQDILKLVRESELINEEFVTSMIERAIVKKHEGYNMIPHKGATAFINDYIDCWNKEGFNLVGSLATKAGKEHPQNGKWIGFRTDIKGLSITHKTDKGYVDLTFKGCRGKTTEIYNLLKETVGEDIQLYNVVDDDKGRSAEIRLKCNKIVITEDFLSQREDALMAMEHVKTLTLLSRKLNRDSVNGILANHECC